MTAALKVVPIFGEGLYAGSPVITRQRRLNCYLEVRKDKEKSTVVLKGTPGLKYAFNAPSAANFPMRGIIGNDTELFVVVSNQVQSLTSAGASNWSKSISSSSGLVGMALNPTQLMVVDGLSGYVLNASSGALSSPGAWFQAGALTICYCNGFFVCELPGSNQFYVSALNDGTSGSALSYAAAVQAIDGIKAVDTTGGLLIIFSAGHCEFWQNIGASPEPFQYIQNSASMFGLAAVNGRVHVGNSLLFVCRTGGAGFQNQTGAVQIARIDGYTVKIVSTSDVDTILQQMDASVGITDATAFSYQVGGHTFAQFNFPAGNRSLLLDTTTGFWSEAQSGVTSGYAARHLGNLAATAFSQAYITDYSNGNVYTFDPDTYTDNGSVIVRELVTRTALNDFNTMRVSELYLDMATGVGLSNPQAQGYQPMVELSIARDNGPFGRPRLLALGAQGQTSTRVRARRLGRARTMTLKVRMTDPVPFIITSGALRTSSRAASPARRAA
jgi:hypothetical protein